MEQKIENAQFARVDADTIDKLVEKGDEKKSNLSEDQKKQLQPMIENGIAKEQFTVVFENLNERDAPMLITRPEFMRRMKDMAAMGGGYDFMGSMPEHYNLVVNTNHPIMARILVETDASKQADLVKQTTDLALLSQQLLKGEDLTKFIQRSLELIK